MEGLIKVSVLLRVIWNSKKVLGQSFVLFPLEGSIITVVAFFSQSSPFRIDYDQYLSLRATEPKQVTIAFKTILLFQSQISNKFIKIHF